MKVRNKNKYDVPLWCKPTMTVTEAAEYSGIGEKKLYAMTEMDECPFVLWIGSRRVIKRKSLVEYLERQYSI